MKIAALDDDVGEIEQMDFQGVQHSLPGHDDLLGPFFWRENTNQSGNFFCSFPFGQLTQPLLAGPNASVDNFEEKLPGSWVEDEDGSVYGLGCQVTFKSFMDCDSVDIGVIDKPDCLVHEEISVVRSV